MVTLEKGKIPSLHGTIGFCQNQANKKWAVLWKQTQRKNHDFVSL